MLDAVLGALELSDPAVGDSEIDVRRSHFRRRFRHIGQQGDPTVVLPLFEQAHGTIEAGANPRADTHPLLDRKAALVLGGDRRRASRSGGRAREKARREREHTGAQPSVRSDRRFTK